MRKLSMDELGRKTAEEAKLSERHKFIVVLDNIRSMHNVGSVFRTADAFLAEAVFLCGYTPQPPHRDIQKTALGATESVDWMYFSSTMEAVGQLRKNGYSIYGIEQTDSSISLADVSERTKQPLAIIFGNEVEGVNEEVLKQCDGVIEIPQFGMKHSLNISVAAGIVMWELVRVNTRYPTLK